MGWKFFNGIIDRTDIFIFRSSGFFFAVNPLQPDDTVFPLIDIEFFSMTPSYFKTSSVLILFASNFEMQSKKGS